MDQCLPDVGAHFFSDNSRSCLCGAEKTAKGSQLADQLRKLAFYNPTNNENRTNDSSQQVEPVLRVT